MDDKLIIDDLPIECVEEILKKLAESENRNIARLVCRFWNKLMNKNSFSETCYVDLKHIKETNNEDKLSSNYDINRIDFTRVIPLFLRFKRIISSFHFEDTFFKSNYIGERFWNQKGANIKSLYFGRGCSSIPFNYIYEKCHQLKTITIIDCLTIQEFIRSLKICVAKRLYYPSCRYLHLRGVQETDLVDIAYLLKMVFSQLCDIYFEEIGCSLKLPERFASLYLADFQELKFKKIKLSAYCGKYEIILDQSDGNAQPVKVNKLTIVKNGDDFFEDDFSFNLLEYRCNFRNSKELYLRLLKFPHSHCELNRIDEVISQCPSLELLSIKLSFSDDITSENVLLTRPLSVNNVQFLNLQNKYYNDKIRTVINEPFLQSFKRLKSFKCNNLVYSDFVKVLRHLENLEVLSVSRGTLDTNHENAVSISNGKLTELEIPNIFLFQTTASYKFENLKELCTYYLVDDNTDINSNMDNLFEKMYYPNILKLVLKFGKTMNGLEEKCIPFISNILLHFPTLNILSLYLFSGPLQCPEFQEKLELIKNAHPKLQKINCLILP